MRNYEHKYGNQIKKWHVEKVLRENGLSKKRQPRVKGRYGKNILLLMF
jgi:hypothetical protein